MKIICESLGDEFPSQYVSLYQTYSILAHGSSITLNHYTKIIKDNAFIFNMPINDDVIIAVGIRAMEIVKDSIIKVLNYLKIDNYIELQITIKDFIDEVIDINSQILYNAHSSR